MHPCSRLLAALSLSLCSISATAAISQDLTRASFRTATCNIDSMVLSFRMDEAFDEPLMTSKLRWQAGSNTSAECLSTLTNVWVRVRTEAGTIKYVKLSPDAPAAGPNFGPTATESPSWGSLFCDAPTEAASCAATGEAKALFESALRFEGFELTTENRTLAGSSPPSPRAQAQSAAPQVGQSLDLLLASAIDQAISPGSVEQKPVTNDPSLTPEQIAEANKRQRDEHARSAVNSVVTLIASSLAQYVAPAHTCETDRVIANWVQARGTCQLNFRSEANHEFTCADNGVRTPIRSTRQANIDLQKDLAAVGPIKVSDEGWASVVLELKDELRSTTEGNYKTNRWQFTANAAKLADLEQLASSILALKQYCERGGSS